MTSENKTAQRLIGRESRFRINRSAAVMYWRELRATEARIRVVELELAAREAVDEDATITIVFDGPASPSGGEPEPPIGLRPASRPRPRPRS
ncbi:MAG: hypothetical protein FJ290_31100 [Planctomycetes bacterium]|nr:hypothetical protein [Planctomycetota bacterium]